MASAGLASNVDLRFQAKFGRSTPFPENVDQRLFFKSIPRAPPPNKPNTTMCSRPGLAPLARGWLRIDCLRLAESQEGPPTEHMQPPWV